MTYIHTVKLSCAANPSQLARNRVRCSEKIFPTLVERLPAQTCRCSRTEVLISKSRDMVTDAWPGRNKERESERARKRKVGRKCVWYECSSTLTYPKCCLRTAHLEATAPLPVLQALFYNFSRSAATADLVGLARSLSPSLSRPYTRARSLDSDVVGRGG